MSDKVQSRRALMGLGAGVALASAGAAIAQSPTSASGEIWRPTFEPQDAWLDRPGTRHRLVFDTTTAAAAETAVFYADNFYDANKTAYGLASNALAVVIVFRHMSTPFGYSDAIWAKYGAAFVDQLDLAGKTAMDAAHRNPLNAADPPESPKDVPVTLATLAAKGARFAVCGMATDAIAGALAKKTGQKSEAVGAELKAGLAPGAVLVAAEIVAVDRAQEHGYAFATTG